MAEAIRTNPSKTSRATVKELAARGVLSSSMVGIRALIRAATGEIDDQGFDLWHLHRDGERLPNFQVGLVECRAWVSYNGGRAKLEATTGMNRTGNPGGHLIWVMRPRLAPRSGHSSALRLQREARCRSVRAAEGD